MAVISASTLAGLRVTDASAQIPEWGCWFAEASIDVESTLKGDVALIIADLALQGTILSGGPAKGRSHYRVVGGKGGWGRTVSEKSYANDLGLKASKVIDDLARDCGETFDMSTVPNSLRLADGFVRAEGPASDTLDIIAPRGWYVGNDGVTRLGKRPSSTLAGAAMHGPVDLAMGSVELASESIAGIMPGLVVDGLTAVDVEHSISAKGGLRSTIWGARGEDSSRESAAFRALFDSFDPRRKYRELVEYRVVTKEGKRLNLQPVRVSTGMPKLSRVRVRPGVAGCDADLTLGSLVLVAFVEADPSRPVVVNFDETGGGRFAPSTLNLRAGTQVGGEHIATVEGMAVLLHNLIVGLAVGITPAAWLTTSGFIVGVINAAIAASNAPPAPPGATAQLAAATGQATAMLSGVGTTVAPYIDAIEAALATKTPNASGLFPSVGAADVETG